MFDGACLRNFQKLPKTRSDVPAYLRVAQLHRTRRAIAPREWPAEGGRQVPIPETIRLPNTPSEVGTGVVKRGADLSRARLTARAESGLRHSLPHGQSS